MRSPDPSSEVVASVCEVARAAGDCVKEILERGVEGRLKADRTLVTAADEQADRLLRTRLLGLVPAGWLSEETADDPARLGRDRLWIVDPLDGTREFVQGLPEYSIAIALVEQREPVLAVVHNPATSEMYWAARGQGAFRNGAPIRVSEGSALLASRSETESGEFAPFVSSWQITATGSIAYKLALIASGQAAVTFSRGPKHEWDVCAGALLVAEAGGRVSDVFGDALSYNQPFPKVKGILAGAPGAYARALEQLRATGASSRMDELT